MSSVICGALFSFVLLVCRPMPAGAQSHGDLRLASNGRVEFFDNQIWRSVCSTGWDEKDAEVVCRQLEEDTFYVEAGSVAFSNADKVGGPITGDVWDCVGTETRLESCPSPTTGECISFAAVTCGSILTTPVIAGIAVGCLAFLLIVAGSIAGCLKCKNVHVSGV
ncbi:galectin-3-binding protein-like [Littorina saxatilis]|uniref:galectin-3-binding protein-like n=1 Tax=Littorina saxatilis TaxID=31220 RepID=UPI0038B6565C